MILFLRSRRRWLGEMYCFYVWLVWESHLIKALGSKSGLYTKIILPKISFNWKNMTRQFFYMDKNNKYTTTSVCLRKWMLSCIRLKFPQPVQSKHVLDSTKTRVQKWIYHLKLTKFKYLVWFDYIVLLSLRSWHCLVDIFMI